MVGVISALIVLASILLVAVVFIQNPKGGGLTSDFGGQQLGGVQRTNDFVEKATWTLAAVVVVASLYLSYLMKPAEVQTPQNTEQGQGQPGQQGQGQPGQGQQGQGQQQTR
ncbi:MAG: preprotein translocase subunit SecG [Fluviicola sp.]